MRSFCIVRLSILAAVAANGWLIAPVWGETANKVEHSENAADLLLYSEQVVDSTVPSSSRSPNSTSPNPVPEDQVPVETELGVEPEIQPGVQPETDPVPASPALDDVAAPNESRPLRLRFSFDTVPENPSALEGPFQPRPTGPGPDEDTGLSLGGSAQLQNLGGGDQAFTIRLRGGEQVLDGELSYTDPIDRSTQGDTGFTVNFFNQRAVQGVFTGGDRDVDLPNGDTPWVHRLGGGLEVQRQLTPSLTGALGLSYQQVSVRDGMFSSDLESEDQLGNALTVNENGPDDLLTLSFSGDWDERDNPEAPGDGYRLLFGIDQAIPVGDASISFTRLSANYWQYVPINLIRQGGRGDSLVVTFQAGTMLGDVPPYEAFNLSSGPVQGYGGIDLGTGSSFGLAAAEYRFPIASFRIFDRPIGLGAALFVGYISDFGTASDVIGEPANVRDKPGEGLGYGFGLRADTPLGLVRLELGFNDQGDSEVVLTTGNRF
ncbi:MAG TPA: BamA/TamA family outer membrane protein [Trichocoleus sp.]|jgi:outer membrane protein insertion porin family